MANKKLIALFVAISTISTSMFCFLDEVVGTPVRATFRAGETVASAPADIATNGETAERRYERWEENDADRRARRDDYRDRARERREERRDRYYYND
jgi:hypothetical protein